MRRILEEGWCPFCHPHELKEPVLREGKYWGLKRNDFPYKHHDSHLILYTRGHLSNANILLLTPEMMAEWWEFNLWAIKEFKLPGGGFVLRFGDPDYHAGTLDHIHSHIQVPNGEGDAVAWFAKSPETLARCRQAIAEFETQLAQVAN